MNTSILWPKWFAKNMVIDNQVLSFMHYSPAIIEMDVHVISTGTDWMAPIISYLKYRMLPDDHNTS